MAISLSVYFNDASVFGVRQDGSSISIFTFQILVFFSTSILVLLCSPRFLFYMCLLTACLIVY
ncbi:hypothetical protein BDV09DRAFT_102724 [Aspergillus tetrazonus]